MRSFNLCLVMTLAALGTTGLVSQTPAKNTKAIGLKPDEPGNAKGTRAIGPKPDEPGNAKGAKAGAAMAVKAPEAGPGKGATAKPNQALARP